MSKGKKNIPCVNFSLAHKKGTFYQQENPHARRSPHPLPQALSHGLSAAGGWRATRARAASLPSQSLEPVTVEQSAQPRPALPEPLHCGTHSQIYFYLGLELVVEIRCQCPRGAWHCLSCHCLRAQPREERVGRDGGAGLSRLGGCTLLTESSFHG